VVGMSLLAVLGGVSCPEPSEKAQAPIEVQANPIGTFDPGNPSQHRFGPLEFRGGLVLSSPQNRFGGISAMRVAPDGADFVALSDRGFWLRGRIVYSGSRPVGIADTVMAPVTVPGGERSERLDTESLAEDRNLLYVGIERENKILRFNFRTKGFPSRPRLVAVPQGIEDLPNNQGLEAMVFVPRRSQRLSGTLVAFSERDLDSLGNLKAFLIGGHSPGTFTVKRTGGYDISDAALLPGGDILLLERQYSVLHGVAMRIRRIPLAEIKPGALVDGPPILETGRREEVDNMEALSVHRAPSGEIILTLMSDDNFSKIQRTLLLQFAYNEEPAKAGN